MKWKEFLKKYWWLIVILIIIYIFLPKPCGIIPVFPPKGGSKCDCIGFSFEDWSGTIVDLPAKVYCIGICHSCKVRYP